jgi:hypothetical protein
MTKIESLESLEEALKKIKISECGACTERFKCFLTNTADRPKQIEDVNLRVANCCYRCVDGVFRQDKEPTSSVFNNYRMIGKCRKNNLAVHQFSMCDDFFPRSNQNGLTMKVYSDVIDEMNHVRRKNKLPMYCIVKDKRVAWRQYYL